MLEYCCSHSKQCRNNVERLCCAKVVVANRPVQHHVPLYTTPDPDFLEHQNGLLSNIKAPCNPRHLSTHAIKHVWNSTKKSPVWTGLKNYRILPFVIFREEGARRFCWDKGEVLDHLRVIWILEQDIRQSRTSLFLLTVDHLFGMSLIIAEMLSIEWNKCVQRYVNGTQRALPLIWKEQVCVWACMVQYIWHRCIGT